MHLLKDKCKKKKVKTRLNRKTINKLTYNLLNKVPINQYIWVNSVYSVITSIFNHKLTTAKQQYTVKLAVKSPKDILFDFFYYIAVIAPYCDAHGPKIGNQKNTFSGEKYSSSVRYSLNRY